MLLSIQVRDASRAMHGSFRLRSHFRTAPASARWKCDDPLPFGDERLSDGDDTPEDEGL